MIAKKSTRIRTENRALLEKVIPLETPFHIFVDPSASCNFNCKFCFNKDKSRTFHKIMEYELFVKIINDLRQFPQNLKVLRLYKEGEPLLNKHLSEMIAYAKKMQVADSIDFTTNGSLLSPGINLQIINAGLDAINISIEGLSRERYFEVSRANIDFEEFVSNIRHFYKNRGSCRVLIKTNDVNVHKDEEEQFYNVFGEICDEIAVEQVVPIWHNVDISDVKSEFDSGIYNQKVCNCKVCPFIFYSMAINSDGSVSSCFSDWEHINIIGDAKKETIFNIWNGEALKELRISHLESKRHLYPACAECKQLTFAAMDNIDCYTADILKKIKSQE